MARRRGAPVRPAAAHEEFSAGSHAPLKPPAHRRVLPCSFRKTRPRSTPCPRAVRLVPPSSRRSRTPAAEPTVLDRQNAPAGRPRSTAADAAPAAPPESGRGSRPSVVDAEPGLRGRRHRASRSRRHVSVRSRPGSDGQHRLVGAHHRAARAAPGDPVLPHRRPRGALRLLPQRTGRSGPRPGFRRPTRRCASLSRCSTSTPSRNA
jgi:hypothetical protein